MQLGDQAAANPGRRHRYHRDLANGARWSTRSNPSPKASGRRQIAAHEPPRTTKLYDCTTDQISLDEIVCTGPPSYGEVAFSAEAR